MIKTILSRLKCVFASTTDTRGAIEHRTRVTFFLPANRGEEVKAIRDVIDYLETQRRDGTVTGFTRSELMQPVFHGYWWDDDLKRWERESVVLFIVDYHFDLDDQKLEKVIGSLKDKIARCYGKYGSEQKSLWVIAQRAIRYV